jgi:hypothetical protein
MFRISLLLWLFTLAALNLSLKHVLIWQQGKPRWVGANRSEFRRDYQLLLIMVPALLVLFEVQGVRHGGGSEVQELESSRMSVMGP